MFLYLFYTLITWISDFILKRWHEQQGQEFYQDFEIRVSKPNDTQQPGINNLNHPHAFTQPIHE